MKKTLINTLVVVMLLFIQTVNAQQADSSDFYVSISQNGEEKIL